MNNPKIINKVFLMIFAIIVLSLNSCASAKYCPVGKGGYGCPTFSEAETSKSNNILHQEDC